MKKRLVARRPIRGFARACGIGVGTLASALVWPSLASAQQPSRNPDKFVIQRDQLGSAAMGDAARARARRGDCVGALEGFDAALRVSIDPTLRRDRGLCHERLGDTFPAIDDYRAYLTALPDAADGDDIRDRLQRLEEKTRADDKHVAPARTGRHDVYDSVKAELNDDSGPLRHGTGWIVGPFIGIRNWFNSNSFASQTWAETVGIRVGGSLNRTSSLFGEVGYQRFNSRDANAIVISGLATQFAYEARLPFKSSDFDNFWLLSLGASYDQLFLNSSGINLGGSPSIAGFGGRGRFGFRHNFGPGVALEGSIDAGVTQFFSTGSSGGSGSTGIFTGLNIALVFGVGSAASSY